MHLIGRYGSDDLRCMSHFYAEFGYASGCCPIRMDTRIYLRPSLSHSQHVRNCIGVVWMCNPGSAGGPFVPRPWGPIPPDPTLRRVLAMLRLRFPATANDNNEYGDKYVQILNLFYAVGVSVPAAWRLWLGHGCKYAEPIPEGAQFAVLAWGRRGTVGAMRLRTLVPPVLAALTATRRIKVIHSFGRAKLGVPPGPLYEADHPLALRFFDLRGVAALI